MNYLKSNIFQVFYLSLLPLTLFSGVRIELLAVSVVVGFLLYRLYKNPTLSLFLFFLFIIATVLVIQKPRHGLDLGLVNVINSQRGEHQGFQTGILPKLIHNKTELIHSFIINVDTLLSPKAIFAAGFWHNLSRYYPLGYLFPWDIFFIFTYIKKVKTDIKLSTLFISAFSILMLLSGLIYIDDALIFSFSIIYFFAILASIGYQKSPKYIKILFAILNIVYLIYQWSVIPYFKS